MINILPLDTVSFEKIIKCFLKAFDGYFVKMSQDPNYYRKRWEGAGVKYDLSFGAFENDRLIGFVIHCVDQRNGDLVAFNTGTGVVPEFRGNGITTLIYNHCLPILRNLGITKSRLEVIQQNLAALKIYKKTGFKITRDYKCFQGNLNTKGLPAILKQVKASDLDWDHMPNQEVQSWDHQRNSLLKGPYSFYQAYIQDFLIGYIAVNPTFNYLVLIEIINDNSEYWGNLLAAVEKLIPKVKINNVDHRLEQKIQALQLAGLQNTVDQYEMELILNQSTQL